MIKLKKGFVNELVISEMAYGGKGIAKVPTEKGDFVLFVPNSIPGQKVMARLVKKRKGYGECRLLEILERSDLEASIPYQAVSGAPFATLDLEKQLFYKKRDSLDQFVRNAGMQNIENLFDEFVQSPATWHYRNKMEYSFSSIIWDENVKKAIDGFGLGSKRRGMWWAVEKLDKDSGLFDEEFENALNKISQYCEDTGLPAWHPPKGVGFFRSLMVRKSFLDNKILISLQTGDVRIDEFDFEAFAKFVSNLFPNRIAGIMHTLNPDKGDRFNNNPTASTLIMGEDTITENILGLNFRVSLSSFFQTNPKSAERLYSKVLEYLKEYEQPGIILDLFCGTGTIGQLVSKEFPDRTVVGVDIENSAIKDAQENAKRNGIDTVEFHAMDAGKFLQANPQYVGNVGVVIIDPPRAGLTGKTLNYTLDIDAKTLIYISCNPSTQSRDTAIIKERGYEMKKYTLVDQFPHTAHIEGIAVFTKNNS
ncbi:MAG: 23S rRNA (uracil1939-C5)-methyltransferase [Patiriisocius sp.]|jgi:23S rRNA (uracil1939-C5)-methyltransferase